MPNLDITPKRDLSPFRKIAIGTWQTTYDPSVYGTMPLRMEEALRYQDAFRAATGKRLTITHMMAKATAAVFEAMPDANAILRFNRIYLRKQIGVFFQVVSRDPETGEIDLSGTLIRDAEQKTLEQVVDEFTERVAKVRARKDEELENTRSMFRRVPYFFLNRLMKIMSFLSYTLNLDLRFLGIPKDAFGSAMITNIGTLGLAQAYVPLVPYSRVPLQVAMGAIEEVPVVDDGELAVGKVMQISATFDHRILDGSHLAHMATTLRAWMENPFEHFDPIPSSQPLSAPEPADQPENDADQGAAADPEPGSDPDSK